MNHERRMQILEAWKTEVMHRWRPHLQGNRYQFRLNESLLEFNPLEIAQQERMPEPEVDVLTFTADHLGRVYCEGLYIGVFPKLRARV